MSYLDLLTEDLIIKILDTTTDILENKISKLEQKIEKLNEKIKPLSITKEFDFDSDIPETMIMISYDRAEYAMDKYLFDRAFNFDGMFRLHLEYDDFWDQTGNGKEYYGDILINPTYFDVLVEINKGINTTKDFSHRYLEDISFRTLYAPDPDYDENNSYGFYIIDCFLGS